MRYLIIDEKRRKNAVDFVSKIPYNSGLCVEIRPYKKNRSLNQNRTAHSWLNIIDRERGEPEGTTKNEIKYAMELFKVVEYQGKNFIQWESTADLSVSNMIKFMESIEIIATSLNIKLPYPDDIRYIMDNRNDKKT